MKISLVLKKCLFAVLAGAVVLGAASLTGCAAPGMSTSSSTYDQATL